MRNDWKKIETGTPLVQMLCEVLLDSGEQREDVYMLDYESWFEADSHLSRGKVVEWRYKAEKVAINMVIK